MDMWKVEDVYHYFFSYAEPRDELFNDVLSIGDLNIVNVIHILFWGYDKLSNTVNDHLFS